MAALYDLASIVAPRRHTTRTLMRFIAGSALLHAALLLAVSEMPRYKDARIETLEVRLENPEPPRVIPPDPVETPRSAAPAQKQTKERLPQKPTPVDNAPPRPEPPPLALPAAALSQQTAEPPAFTMPQREPARAEPAGVATAAKAEPPATEKSAVITPPSFNAAYLRNPPPRYPLTARRSGEQGTVTLRVFVTGEGLPESVSVQSTSGHRSLDQAALEAVKGWRFAPARQGAQTVADWVLVPIVFKLEGTS